MNLLRFKVLSALICFKMSVCERGKRVFVSVKFCAANWIVGHRGKLKAFGNIFTEFTGSGPQLRLKFLGQPSVERLEQLPALLY